MSQASRQREKDKVEVVKNVIPATQVKKAARAVLRVTQPEAGMIRAYCLYTLRTSEGQIEQYEEKIKLAKEEKDGKALAEWQGKLSPVQQLVDSSKSLIAKIENLFDFSGRAALAAIRAKHEAEAKREKEAIKAMMAEEAAKKAEQQKHAEQPVGEAGPTSGAAVVGEAGEDGTIPSGDAQGREAEGSQGDANDGGQSPEHPGVGGEPDLPGAGPSTGDAG